MINLRDIKISDDGDIFEKNYYAYSENEDNQVVETFLYKDFDVVDSSDCIRQNVLIRLKTNIKELILHEDFGNKLRKIIGKRNTRDTAYEAKQLLLECICKSNYIGTSMVDISAFPQDQSSIVFIIEIVLSDGIEPVRIFLDFGLQDGIRRFL